MGDLAAARAGLRGSDRGNRDTIWMPSYQCFALDSTFHVIERLSIECDNDEHAIVTAAELLERRPDIATIEVWDGTRLVQRLVRTRQSPRD